VSYWEIVGLIEQTPEIVLDWIVSVPGVTAVVFGGSSEEGTDDEPFFTVELTIKDDIDPVPVYQLVGQSVARALGVPPTEIFVRVTTPQKRFEAGLEIGFSGGERVRACFIMVALGLLLSMFL
jgi:hypothetical protein